MLTDAKSEALRAVDALEKIGVVKHVEDCGALIREIEVGSLSQNRFQR